MNRHMLLLIAITATVLALTSWLSQREEAPAPVSAEASAQQPDYFIHGLEATVTDAEGRPRHLLNAASLTHYPASDTTELEQLQLTVFNQAKPHWYARADQGEAYGNNQLALRGGVRLEQRSQQGLTVLTERLNIDTARRYASTGAKVTVLGQQARLEGVGMEAFTESHRLRLLAQVRGEYATP